MDTIALDVDIAAIKITGSSSGIEAPQIGLLREVTALARVDGLFVVRMSIDPSAVFADEDDLFHLAKAVCMQIKIDLGHPHDVHGPQPPGVVQSKKSPNSAVSAGSWSSSLSGITALPQKASANAILVCDPVLLDPKLWSVVFAAKPHDLSDQVLRAAIGLPPVGARSRTPRHALICLRRNYLKIFEELQKRVVASRGNQITWQRSTNYRVALLALSLVATLLLYAVKYVLSEPWTLASLKDLQQVALALIFFFVLWACLTTAIHVALNFIYGELRRIRLLRSAVTFYRYVNPLNPIIARVLSIPATAATPAVPVAVTDFTDLIGIVQSKTEGEVHRASIGHLWMTLSIATAALALTAFPSASEAGPLEPTDDTTVNDPADNVGQAIEFGLDCGDGGLRFIGPFKDRSGDTLADDAVETKIALKHFTLPYRAGPPRQIILIGSSDEKRVKAGPDRMTNEKLASLRAGWVKDRLVSFFQSAKWTVPPIVLLNDETGLARIVGREEKATGKIVVICALWAESAQSSAEADKQKRY